MAALDKLGPALLALRERSGLTQERVAEETGIARDKISKYETGASGRRPALATLEKLLDFYEVDILDLGCELRRLTTERAIGTRARVAAQKVANQIRKSERDEEAGQGQPRGSK